MRRFLEGSRPPPYQPTEHIASLFFDVKLSLRQSMALASPASATGDPGPTWADKKQYIYKQITCKSALNMLE